MMLRVAKVIEYTMGLFEELKRRNVFRVGAAYLLFAWVIIQVTDTIGPALHLPEWTLALVTWISIIGFPVALFFAWAFELTPDGITAEKNVDRSKSITRETGYKINYVIIALMGLAIILLIGKDFVGNDGDETDTVAESVVDDADSPRKGFDSIGVLPFVNMSEDPAQEYFSDGISEELLNALAKLKDLQVAARTSSFAFKGRNQAVTDIGTELNVDTVLEGSVRKSGTKIRITAQLIEVETGYHLWSETYDRELTDIFAVQDEITAAIVDALLPHLNTGEEPEIIKAEATNMSAYDAYLQGRHHSNNMEPDSLRKALQSFRAATDADPDFAAAWAARATTVIAMRETAFTEGIPREESVLLASNAIERALAIDPNLPEAYVAQATLYADSYDFDAALESLSKALEINPSLVEALRLHARILSRFGRIKEAQRDILKALRLDPHNRITAILAANLADEFFEPEFFATVERSTVQFERAREIFQRRRLIMDRDAMLREFREAADGDEAGSPFITRARYSLLKELDRERIFTFGRVDGMVLMWVLIASDRWDEAQEIYNSWPERIQRMVINLEEISIMQASQGECELALESLREAHGDEVRVYGEINPNAPRSNSNLALNRVHCLRQLGRADEADEILARVRTYVETLRQNTVYGFFMIQAKLLVLDSDAGGALDVLEAAHERDELSWLARYDPVLRTIADESRFQALFKSIDDEIDAMRAELGMPPAAL
jgi:TolB-like protein/Tfp pilus assembly protein PilF